MKVTENNSDIQTLEYDSIENKEYFKSIDIESLIEKLETYVANRDHKKFGKITLMDDVIIGFGKDAVVINQPGHKRIVTYRQKAYKINFPNAIYIMYHRANKICQIDTHIATKNILVKKLSYINTQCQTCLPKIEYA